MGAALAKLTDRFTETGIDDETVVMNIDTGEFYALRDSGKVIWELIDGVRDRDALLSALAGEFGCGIDEIAADVDGFVAGLRQAGLLAAA